MDFTREELWVLESRARQAADDVLNENWKRAFQDLQHAACVVDAFIARSSETTEVRPKQIPLVAPISEAYSPRICSTSLSARL